MGLVKIFRRVRGGTATIDGSITAFAKAKCRRFLEGRFTHLGNISPLSQDAQLFAVRATLLDLVNDAPTHPRDLGHCLDFLCDVLDSIDDIGSPHTQDAQHVCEHLFVMITNLGIWGSEDAGQESDFVGLSPV